MQTGLEQRNNGLARPGAMKLLALILLAVLLFSLCVDGLFYGFNTPLQVLISLKTWVQLQWAHLMHSQLWVNRAELLASLPYYGSVIRRVQYIAMTFGCGMLMALAGAIFQMVFRNPMAAPTMLGVSTGVNVGVLFLVLQYGAMAYSMMSRKYLYCYFGAMIMLALVLVMGKISSGRHRMSVFDLLIVAAILSQVVNAGISYYTTAMENDEALVYQEIVGALKMDVSGRAFAVLGVAMLVSIVPMFLLRFSFNAVSFESDDTRSLGVNAYAMKIFTLILGTIMMTAAMMHCGSAGMISLAAPFLARGLCGAEFRRQFWGNLLIGGGLLVLCKDVAGLIPFGDNGLPLGTIVDFVVLPLFVVIVASQRRIWQ